MMLIDACAEVMADRELQAQYPKGMDSGDILTEIRVKHGADAFALCTILDVHDEMTKLYGRPPR